MLTSNQNRNVGRLAVAQALSMTSMNVNIINTALVGVLLAFLVVFRSQIAWSMYLNGWTSINALRTLGQPEETAKAVAQAVRQLPDRRTTRSMTAPRRSARLAGR